MVESPSNLLVDIGDYNGFPELCKVQTMVSELDRKPTLHDPKDLEMDAKDIEIECRVTLFETCETKFEETIESFMEKKV